MESESEEDGNSEEGRAKVLMRKLKILREKVLQAGVDEKELEALIRSELEPLALTDDKARANRLCHICNFNVLSLVSLTAVAVALFLKNFDIRRDQCAIRNNYLVMEITRPITDCNICKDLEGVRIMENLSKAEFQKYAYLSQPMLVKGGCADWKAMEVFSFDFFRKLYNETEGAYRSVEEECQFFPFKTEFLSLEEVLNMPESRGKRTSPDEKTWYIGWSNCHPTISSVLRQHYTRPYFLPDDSELSAIDWIFMGYSGQGASMHLDYVQRPSWQAQISGSKRWHLNPVPECESVCPSMNITVYKGDIVLIDTNQWYHKTFVVGDEMSITLGSEYD